MDKILMRVLLVDESKRRYSSLFRRSEERGCSYKFASSFCEGVQLIGRSFDLVLCSEQPETRNPSPV